MLQTTVTAVSCSKWCHTVEGGILYVSGLALAQSLTCPQQGENFVNSSSWKLPGTAVTCSHSYLLCTQILAVHRTHGQVLGAVSRTVPLLQWPESRHCWFHECNTQGKDCFFVFFDTLYNSLLISLDLPSQNPLHARTAYLHSIFIVCQYLASCQSCLSGNSSAGDLHVLW